MNDLQNIREEIDKIDDSIIELFSQRMEKSRQVAEFKKHKDMPVLNAEREKEILTRVTDAVDEDMIDYAALLYSTIFDLSRSYQTSLLTTTHELSDKINSALSTTPKQLPKKALVACQGTKGAYSQKACEKFFPLPSIMYFESFEGVFSAVEKGLCQYGVLPIENSTAGSVNQVYDLMSRHKFYIVSCTRLKVQHSLLCKKGVSLSEIKEVFSHEQAINQCSDFLSSNPKIKVTVCENTATAAKSVAESDRKDVAAICSGDCAELYGLSSLEENIQNNQSNYTRFILISKELMIFPGANKSSLMLSLAHRPGALCNVLSQIAAAGMNLTKLESRPVADKEFEFNFYFDLEGSIYDEKTVNLLCGLEGVGERFSFLGSYLEK